MRRCTALCGWLLFALSCSSSDVCVEEKLSYQSARNITIVSRIWRGKDPSPSTKALVVLQHGFHWHSGYFGPLASELAHEGYVVMAPDLQGHGRSGNLDGLRAYADRFDHYVEDLEQGVQLFLERESKAAGVQRLPCFLFGESMGGTVVLKSSLRPHLSGRIAGLLLAAPVIRVAEEVLPPPWMLWGLRVVSSFMPRMKVPAHQDDTFDQAFGDKSWAAKARADPLVVFEPPRLRTADEIISTCEQLADTLHLVSAPLFVLHGTEDVRTSAENSKELIERAASADKELKLYPGAAHQLLQDKADITKNVIADIKQWIGTRVQRT